MKFLVSTFFAVAMLVSAFGTAQAQDVKWRLQSIVPVNTFFFLLIPHERHPATVERRR